MDAFDLAWGDAHRGGAELNTHSKNVPRENNFMQSGIRGGTIFRIFRLRGGRILSHVAGKCSFGLVFVVDPNAVEHSLG